MIWSFVVPAVVTLMGLVINVVIANRRMSGKINTSDASDLWAESASIRQDYRERLITAGERTVRLEDRVAQLEGRNSALVEENIHCKEELASVKALVANLKDQIADLGGG